MTELSLWLKASDVAAAIGKNRWKSRDDIIHRYKFNQHKDYFDRSERESLKKEVDVKELTEKIVQAKKRFIECEHIDEPTKKKLCTNLDKAIEIQTPLRKVEALASAISESITENDSSLEPREAIIRDLDMGKQVEKQVVANMNKRVGTVREESVRVAVEKDKQMPVRKTNDLMTKVLSFNLKSGQQVKMKLCGRVDGKMQDGTLIEIKNRMKKMYYRIWPNEEIQSMVYMFLTKATRAIVIEAFGSERHESHLEFCDEKWEDIRDGLREYAEQYVLYK